MHTSRNHVRRRGSLLLYEPTEAARNSTGDRCSPRQRGLQLLRRRYRSKPPYKDESTTAPRSHSPAEKANVGHVWIQMGSLLCLPRCNVARVRL
jgi:hypothetical protein